MKIEDLVEERVKNIRKQHPDMSVDSIVQESEFGKFGVILYTGYDFSIMGYDFIESATSWKRPGAVKEYNCLSEEGYCVVVYVPDKQKSNLRRMLREKGGRSRIRVHSIEKAIIP